VKQEISREEYRSRIIWLTLSRIVLASFLISSLLVFQFKYQIFHFNAILLLHFGSAVAAVSILYWYLLNKLRNLSLLAYIQVFGDILLISWLVSFTGVIDSSLSILYHVTIISASIILYRRGGYFAASLSSILFGGMLDMQYYNILGYVRSYNYSSIQVLYLLLVNIFSFYFVAFLSGYLSERLRKVRLELREKSIDFEDLRVLQDHILRSVGSGIMTMDMGGEITSWNNAAEHITGYPFDDIRKNWKTVFGDSMKGLFGHTDDLKAGPVRFEGKILKRSGAAAILGFTATLLKDDQNLVRGIIITFQDITRLMEMEDQMRRQERLATVGSLAAGIAHEIRNPLASLSGSIQMLREELDLKADSKRLMDIVLRETERLNIIITDFLDYARPKNSRQERIDLNSLVQETVTLFRNSRDFREGISVHCEIDTPRAVMGDPLRLRQVFWNLLINAAQAIGDRGAIWIIASSSRGHADEITITVTDDGSGIPPENLGKIFDPFFTTKNHGTGLGLAIAYRIIEDHKGTIDVKSGPGKGTTFTIHLPSAEIPLSQNTVSTVA
jgi:two-component system sensor histidine kinase PilS (NtrC family)